MEAAEEEEEAVGCLGLTGAGGADRKGERESEKRDRRYDRRVSDFSSPFRGRGTAQLPSRLPPVFGVTIAEAINARRPRVSGSTISGISRGDAGDRLPIVVEDVIATLSMIETEGDRGYRKGATTISFMCQTCHRNDFLFYSRSRSSR